MVPGPPSNDAEAADRHSGRRDNAGHGRQASCENHEEERTISRQWRAPGPTGGAQLRCQDSRSAAKPGQQGRHLQQGEGEGLRARQGGPPSLLALRRRHRLSDKAGGNGPPWRSPASGSARCWHYGGSTSTPTTWPRSSRRRAVLIDPSGRRCPPESPSCSIISNSITPRSSASRG